MINTVICDLDGPILDCHERHYHCYRTILSEFGQRSLDIGSYWEMKRNHCDLNTQLKAVGAELLEKKFLKRWLEIIELPTVLKLDRLQPGAVEQLKYWHNRGKTLLLVTLRQDINNLRNQLLEMKLDSYWKKTIVSDHRAGGQGKARNVKDEFPLMTRQECVWIGDSEVDVEAARYFGCKIWLVDCGVRDRKYLLTMNPDFISSGLKEIDLEHS